MIRELTCGLGVGASELAADDDLVRLCPVEVTAGIGELAEEVADVALGAFVQSLEVGRELDGDVSAEMKRWLEADLRCGIDKEEQRLTQGGDGAAEERWKIPRRRACCSPCARGKKERLGFLAGGGRRQRKLWPMKRLQCRWGGL